MDITEKPYAAWLEEGLREITRNEPRSMAFVAIMENETVYTGYWNADSTDKAVMAHNITVDSMMDVIRNNGTILKEAIEKAEGEE